MSLDATSRLSAGAIDAGLDAVVCVSPQNVAYALGFVIRSQPLIPSRLAAAVTTAGGLSAVVCVDMEFTTVQGRRPDLDVRSWAEFGGSAMATLAELICDLGLGAGRVGIELGYLSVHDHQALTELLPDVKLVAADGLLSQARRVKSSVEIEVLSRLSRIADRAIGEAFGSVAAGNTEMDLAAALTRSVYQQGAEEFKLLIVATGERSQLPNVGPSERVLQVGDVCRMEIFPVIDGYQAGVCRTAVVGEPPPFAQTTYDNLVACRQLVLDTIRPGVPAHRVHETFMGKFDELGMPPIAFVGHSIGLDLHEEPYLAPFSDAKLEAGMVFGIEPLVYRTSHGFGMQIKDMVLVEEDGCRVLSDVTDPTTLLRIRA